MFAERVLVVDSDRAICYFCRAILEHEGYFVDTISDEVAAVRVVEKKSYRAVLVDFSIESERSRGFVRAVRKASPGTAVIIMSGIGETELSESEADATILKPFDVDTFILKLKSCLENRKICKENAL